MNATSQSTPKVCDVKACDNAALQFQNSGPQWGESSDELNVTALSWENGKGVQAHINAELDVCIVVIAGEGEAIIDDEKFVLRPGVALVIPKGSTRAIASSSERLTYYSIHRRRPGLMPKFAGTK